MNDLSKTIDVDKSSLISLKAELLRKKDEALSARKQAFIPKKIPKARPTTPASEKSANKTEEKNTDPEEDLLLKKSREVLERKSRFYDQMSKSNSSNENYLVMFDQKSKKSPSISPEPEEIEIGPPIPPSFQSVASSSSNDREVEYIDCLGRTRIILEKDLLKVKAEDKELYESAELRKEQFKDNKVFSHYLNNINIGENFQQQRINWENQESKNQMEDFVHYQDIVSVFKRFKRWLLLYDLFFQLYNEAREHGVGEYQFLLSSRLSILSETNFSVFLHSRLL